MGGGILRGTLRLRGAVGREIIYFAIHRSPRYLFANERRGLTGFLEHSKGLNLLVLIFCITVSSSFFSTQAEILWIEQSELGLSWELTLYTSRTEINSVFHLCGDFYHGTSV